MKEKPILFSTPMVQAILSGHKTQTRRIVKQNEIDKIANCILSNHHISLICKYKIGDTLWVRETWQQECVPVSDDFGVGFKATGNYLYKANGSMLPPKSSSLSFSKWKPSIFMPREACRLFLEVTNIKVEKLQDISEQDAIKEGCIRNNKPHNGWCFMDGIYSTDTPEYAYECLWKHINGEQSWNYNPYVWVIDFKVK